MIFAALAVSALPAQARKREIDPLARARAAMGGAGLLARVRSIGWSGAARLFAPGRTIEVLVEARIEPFVRARSFTWLASDDRSARRTLMVEGNNAFAVLDGRQMALAPEQAEHERQQFGIYGHMLLAGVAIARGSNIASAKAGFPEALFTLGRDGSYASADYRIAAPDGVGSIRERFTFSGQITDQGLTWPRRIAIARDGKAFSSMVIDDLTVELAPA